MFICGAVAALGTFAAYVMVRRLGDRQARTGYRYGQIGSAALVSLAHGTNDAQKTMGIIALALISTGHIDANHFYVPFWVKLVCALAISLGTVTGGWRIINTMGNRITSIESPQGFAAEAASGSVILASSYYGYPLSTTQVVSGGVTGAGIGKKQPVHWAVFGQMVSAWILTIPAAGIVAAGAWEIADIFGSNSDVGCIVIVAITIVIAAALWTISRRTAVTAKDLDRTNVTPEQEADRQPASATPRRPRSPKGQTCSSSETPSSTGQRSCKIVIAALVGGCGIVIVFGFLLLGLKFAGVGDAPAKRTPNLESVGYALAGNLRDPRHRRDRARHLRHDPKTLLTHPSRR